MDRNDFKRRFPSLAKEIELGNEKFDINDVNATDIMKKERKDEFAGYTPTAIDYLRRCDNDKQAEDTITCLEDKGEISSEYAGLLRNNLREKGLRSFGTRKEDGYYLKKSGYG